MRAAVDSDVIMAAEALVLHRHVICLTGAGMSVESGIRPFRGADGLWTEHGEPPLDDYSRFLEDPVTYWQELLQPAGHMAELRDALERAQPHEGHRALAALERREVMKSVITQNIDNLHRKAGSTRIAEIHGNYTLLRCPGCGRRFHRQRLAYDTLPPKCHACGETIKSDVVIFGEPIPGDVAAVCLNEVGRADCMLLVGTSGYVYPAAGFPRQVKANGGTLIEINPSDTELSALCDIVVRSTAVRALPRLVEALVDRLSPPVCGSRRMEGSWRTE
jgi:NAD-dependent deacetylase